MGFGRADRCLALALRALGLQGWPLGVPLLMSPRAMGGHAGRTPNAAEKGTALGDTRGAAGEMSSALLGGICRVSKHSSRCSANDSSLGLLQAWAQKVFPLGLGHGVSGNISFLQAETKPTRS